MLCQTTRSSSEEKTEKLATLFIALVFWRFPNDFKNTTRPVLKEPMWVGRILGEHSRGLGRILKWTLYLVSETPLGIAGNHQTPTLKSTLSDKMTIQKFSHGKVKDSNAFVKLASPNCSVVNSSDLLQSPQIVEWWLPGSSLSFLALIEQIHQTPTLLWESGPTQTMGQAESL